VSEKRRKAFSAFMLYGSSVGCSMIVSKIPLNSRQNIEFKSHGSLSNKGHKIGLVI